MPNPNRSETLAWIHAEHFAAQSAINELTAACKDVIADYRGRIRLMREYQTTLHNHADSDQIELFKPEDVLSADIKRIKTAPLAGLR